MVREHKPSATLDWLKNIGWLRGQDNTLLRGNGEETGEQTSSLGLEAAFRRQLRQPLLHLLSSSILFRRFNQILTTRRRPNLLAMGRRDTVDVEDTNKDRYVRPPLAIANRVECLACCS